MEINKRKGEPQDTLLVRVRGNRTVEKSGYINRNTSVEGLNVEKWSQVK